MSGILNVIYMNCHTTMDSPAHCVPRHQSLIALPPEHL